MRAAAGAGKAFRHGGFYRPLWVRIGAAALGEATLGQHLQGGKQTCKSKVEEAKRGRGLKKGRKV